MTLALLSAVVAATALLVGTGLQDDGSWTVIDEGAWVELRVDRTAALLITAFTALAAIVATYAHRAFDDAATDAVFQRRLCLLVAGASLVAVPGGPLFLLAGWLISSRALVGMVAGWIDTTAARTAVARLRRSMLIADGALILAVVVSVLAVGPEVVSVRPDAVADLQAASLLGLEADLVVAALLVVAGGARSVLLPFHRWLTATVYAPSPVSAIVHAGFVAGAGVVLVRFAPVIVAVDAVLWLVGVAAVLTLVIGLLASLSRPDTKGALAWSTVAQMAFMVVQAVVGGFAAAIVHIVGHGMYKAAQFLGAGETVSAGLRSTRRPRQPDEMDRRIGGLAAVVVATVAVGAGFAVGPTDLSDAESILLGGFVWLALAGALRGFFAAGTLRSRTALVTASVGALVASAAYFLALRATKAFLDPSMPAVEVPAGIATPIALMALGSVALLVVLLAVPALGPARRTVRWWVDRITASGGHRSARLPTGPAAEPRVDTTVDESDDAVARRRAALRAHVNRAAEIVAPAWPLSSFVAVNPLTGLEHLDFDQAGLEAAPLRGRTYRSLAEFRSDHDRGLTDDTDLAWAAVDVATVACSQAPLLVGGQEVTPEQIVTADLLHGPEGVVAVEPRTELERRLGSDAGERLGLDDLAVSWVLDHLAAPMLPIDELADSFWALARGRLERHAAASFGPAARAFVARLGDDPLDAIDRSLTACGVRPWGRVDELRGLVASVRGAVAIARWRTDWAQPEERTPMIRVVEIVAARAVLDALAVIELGDADPVMNVRTEPADDAAFLAARAERVIAELDLPADGATRIDIADVLALVPDPMRQMIWQRAQERRFERDTLTLLDQVDDEGGRAERPSGQVVFCIDVRSEGIRRHLEALGSDETLGFAGFFGIPMQVREIGWSEAEPRCPVLVAPSATATETGVGHETVRRTVARRARQAAATAAHAGTKYVPGAAFAAAEAVGVFSAVRAARRTLAPSRHRPAALASDWPTQVTFDAAVGLEQRVFWAESVLRTMGLFERFARIVVLCGHTSHTVNNAHATALECGACGGAGGAANARAVAALLNDDEVRVALAARGITIPADTWFTGAVHETTTDEVTLLDGHLAPASHADELVALRSRLAVAGDRQAADRARVLPGDPARVRDRGMDWAEPRPEWGLAGNAAFIIAPRSSTAGLDLEGRAFLHGYDAEADPEGTVLEAIMTAPLVVGHWISAQYYFSTVDPEGFGAGDKLLHNPVGTLGVLSGASGDLRVGLPLQSTMVGDQLRHQPLRLLALIQADPVVVERIIARNPILTRLVEGSWIRIAARPSQEQPWSTRDRRGTWSTETRGSAPRAMMEVR